MARTADKEGAHAGPGDAPGRPAPGRQPPARPAPDRPVPDGPAPDLPPPAALAPGLPPPVVVLVGTSHPGNVGAAARGARNFGVTDLRFVAPRCDVRGAEALERAVHAAPLLEAAEIHDTLEAALRGTSLSVGTTARASTAPNHFLRKPRDVRAWADGLAGWRGTVALVFGREDFGLSREEVNLMDDLVTIPTSDYASLNLAHAVSLVCYEHLRARADAGIAFERVLDADAMAALHRAWDALTDEAETRPWRQEVAKAVWRKILGRSLPDGHEVHNVMGVLTRALKRFNHPDFRTATSETFLRERGLLVERDGEQDGEE